MTVTRHVLLSSMIAGLLGGACDDSPQKPVVSPGIQRMTGKVGVPGAAPKPAPPPKQAVPVKVAQQHPELTDEDFVSNIDKNRDPFRSYLRELATPMRRTVKVQRKVLMQRYALEELKLIAVVTGRTKPLAMFRDPTGLGISVMRGDYLSKSAGRVKQILPDRVIVQIEEYTEDQQRVADRVLYLGR